MRISLSSLSDKAFDAHMAAIDAAAFDAQEAGVIMPGIFEAGDAAAAEEALRGRWADLAWQAREFLSRFTTGMSRKDAARWKTARTMADLGELVIAWLNGEITQTPGHCGPPCRETIPLIGALTVINRGGFVTDNSQLAETWEGRTWNTWVQGFASDETIARIREAAEGTRLIVRACRGRTCECGRHWLPPCGRRGVTGFWASACPDAADALRGTWWVYVEDPEPGRNDLLWPALVSALERS